MPIDAGIPSLALAGLPRAQPFDLAATLDNAAIVQQRQAAVQKAQRDAQTDQQVQQLAQQYGDDYDGLAAAITRIDPERGQKLATEIARARTEGAQTHLKELEVGKAQLAEGISLLQGANADNWDEVSGAITKMAPQLTPFVKRPYSDDLRDGLIRIGQTADQFTDTQTKAAQLLIDQKPREAVATLYAGASTPQIRAVADGLVKKAGLSALSQYFPDQASAQAYVDSQKKAEPDKLQSPEQEAIKAYARDHGKDPSQLSQKELEQIHRGFKESGTVVRVTAGGAGGGPAVSSKTWDTTGEDVLKMISPQWRNTVKKIGDYDEDPTKVLAARGGERSMVMRWVNQYNPNYKQDEFAIRSPTRKAFTTGTQGQQINAMNTAIGHIEQLGQLVDGLGNGDFTPGNKAWNSLRTMFGSDKVTNFDTLKDALSGEVASILSKNGATVSGIADAREKISAANSPSQLAGYVRTQIPIMGSKLAALDYQYKQAMGDDKFSALSPDSKRILQKYGFDPDHPTIASSGMGGTTQNTGLQVGQVVSVRGKQIKVTKVLPNGQFEGVPVQ